MCNDAKEMLGAVKTVAVKKAITRYTARSIHPEEAKKRIQEAAKSVMGNLSNFKPYKMDPPYNLQIRMHNSGMADNAETMPGAIRIDPVTIEFKARDVMTMFKGLLTLTQLAGLSIPKVRPK